MWVNRMRDKVELWEPVVTVGAYGDEATAWTSRGTAHVERVTLTGHGSEEAGEHFDDYRATWNVRMGSGVKPGWRVKDVRSGLLYTVMSIVAVPHRGFEVLSCERVNE